jgi:hypothetical protein
MSLATGDSWKSLLFRVQLHDLLTTFGDFIIGTYSGSTFSKQAGPGEFCEDGFSWLKKAFQRPAAQWPTTGMIGV